MRPAAPTSYRACRECSRTLRVRARRNPSVYPRVGIFGFFAKVGYSPVRGYAQRPEAGGRADGGEGGDFAGFAVAFEQGGNVDVGDPVAVGQHESLIADVLFYLRDSAARQCVCACVAQCDFPWLGAVFVDFHGVVAEVYGMLRRIGAVV